MIKVTFVALLANKLVCGHGQHLHKGMRADYHFFINLGTFCQLCGLRPKSF